MFSLGELTISFLWYFCFRILQLSVCSLSLSELVTLELVAVNFCQGVLLSRVFWYHCHSESYRLMLFELVRTADDDLTVLMRYSKDGSEYIYRRVLPGPVVHLFLELWLVLSISCQRLLCNIQSHW